MPEVAAGSSPPTVTVTWSPLLGSDAEPQATRDRVKKKDPRKPVVAIRYLFVIQHQTSCGAKWNREADPATRVQKRKDYAASPTSGERKKKMETCTTGERPQEPLVLRTLYHKTRISSAQMHRHHDMRVAVITCRAQNSRVG